MTGKVMGYCKLLNQSLSVKLGWLDVGWIDSFLSLLVVV